jgi:hypothetical protein
MALAQTHVMPVIAQPFRVQRTADGNDANAACNRVDHDEVRIDCEKQRHGEKIGEHTEHVLGGVVHWIENRGSREPDLHAHQVTGHAGGAHQQRSTQSEA